MTKTWLVPVVLAGGVFGVYATTGGCLNSKEPDQKLASRFDDLCDIAETGAKKPEQGVRKLGRYLADHSGDMLKDLADTVALIERISDDSAHDARAGVARDRIHKPLIDCAETWMEFGDAIAADPAATELMNKGVERIGRTLEIILGEGDTLEIRDLPAALMHRFDHVTE